MFNDPFDCRPAFNFMASKRQIKDDFGRLQKKFEPQVNRQTRRSEVRQLFKDPNRDPRRLEVQNSIQGNYDAEMNKVGVLCVSEVNDDILMWSHYADSHRGICIEFDGHNKFMVHAQAVTYAKERASIRQFIRADPQIMLEKAMLTKAQHWSYEKEWRLIQYEKGHGVVAFRPENLTGIIFGAQASPKMIERIQVLLTTRPQPVALYRAQVDRKAFKIHIHR